MTGRSTPRTLWKDFFAGLPASANNSASQSRSSQSRSSTEWTQRSGDLEDSITAPQEQRVAPEPKLHEIPYPVKLFASQGVAQVSTAESKTRTMMHDRHDASSTGLQFQPLSVDPQVESASGYTQDPIMETVSGNVQNHQPPAASADSHDSSTTLMVRNLPPDLCQDQFASAFLQNGHAGLLDFVYMPMNFRGKGNFGYAFINFASHEVAEQAMTLMQSFDQADPDSPLQAHAWGSMWSTCQGVSGNVERYRNSPLMHELVPEGQKPAMYDGYGARVPFPKPTRSIPKPRANKLGKQAGGDEELLHPGRSKRQFQGLKSRPSVDEDPQQGIYPQMPGLQTAGGAPQTQNLRRH